MGERLCKELKDASHGENEENLQEAKGTEVEELCLWEATRMFCTGKWYSRLDFVL